eukprot:TRINITY_DN9906_c0_g1_i1.p1 TRINITY_DN9906_c0_g1~~TRINITY_DN9906_c0_g1_i1.p1  ORF type:complete len:494 (+),score=79.40 TRINITY_DN9906_c0_g1_i1:86-1567(+)
MAELSQTLLPPAASRTERASSVPEPGPFGGTPTEYDPRGAQHMINPIKLKALAMRLRHKVGGVEFRKRVQDQDEEQFSGGMSAPSSDSVQVVAGPHNLTGLATIFLHPFSVLLLAVPLGLLSEPLGWGDSWTFWLNFLALVPLAKILGDATEELAASLNNDTVTGLLNATFGNAVEMIVSIQSIRTNLLDIVKASLLGSVLSNILLVLGTAFFLGGLTASLKQRSKGHSFHMEASSFAEKAGKTRFEKEQKFGQRGALISLAMLLFSCMSFALPTIFNSYPSDDHHSVLQVSRIGSIIVLSCYVAYLVFQLLTHERTLAADEDNEEDDDDDVGAGLTKGCAMLLMAVTTLIVALNSDCLVRAIETVVKDNGIPESFIGVILLPIAGNACEHASAIRFAMVDRPGLAIGIAVGSSTQIALLVVPFSVLVGWALGRDLDLDFGTLNVAVITFVILVVLTLVLDGRSNWFKGYILVAMYAFLGVLYWYLPHAIQHS